MDRGLLTPTAQTAGHEADRTRRGPRLPGAGTLVRAALAAAAITGFGAACAAMISCALGSGGACSWLSASNGCTDACQLGHRLPVPVHPSVAGVAFYAFVDVLQDPEVRRELWEHWIPVRVSPEAPGGARLAKMGVAEVPTSVAMNADGSRVAIMRRIESSAVLLERLRAYRAAGAHVEGHTGE